jgi:hypothetical protein
MATKTDAVKKEGVKITGRIGTWYEIDSLKVGEATYYLLESERYGDEAAALVVNENMSEICETFDGLELSLMENYILSPSER